MGAQLAGRKLETSSCTFGNSYDNAERILGAVDSRSADQRMYLALGNPFVPQAIQRSKDAPGYQSVDGGGRNTEGRRGLGDRIGQRFGGDCRCCYDIGG